MAKKQKICKKCGLVIEDENLKECPVCGNNKFTTFWQGYAIIVNPEKSEVAKILNINVKGKYALRIS